MKLLLTRYIFLGLSSLLTAHAVALAAEDPSAKPCSTYSKGMTQTPAGMCIDGVLFKDVLARIAALERYILSSTTPQGKPEH